MAQEKITNVHRYKAADDIILRNFYLIPLIENREKSATGYIEDIALLKEFLFEYNIFTYPQEKDYEKRIVLDKTTAFADCMDINRTENSSYSLTCDLTYLALKDKELYFHVTKNFESDEFRNSFCCPSDDVFQQTTQKIYYVEEDFYEFDRPYHDLKQKPAHVFYAGIKELQFYAQKYEMVGKGEEVCDEAVRFLTHLGLVEKDLDPYKREMAAFDVAQSVYFAKNRLRFTIDVEGIQDVDARIQAACGLTSEAFLSQASKIDRRNKDIKQSDLCVVKHIPQ